MHLNNINTQKCGIITIIGPTNAGKSTLINALVNKKVSIVTHKVQTTRFVIRGIAVHNNAQLIFVDTPGIFSPKGTLEKIMVNTAMDACYDTEITMLVVDSNKGITYNIKKILKKISAPAIVVLNKIDLVNKIDLLKLTAELNELFPFDKTFMISALKKRGIEDIKEYLAGIAPQEPWAYPEEQISDAPLNFILSEVTREKIFLRVHQEIPYRAIVETEKIEETDSGITVHQIAYITSENHKKIIIGKRGSALRDIIKNSIYEMQKKLQKQVTLNLFIKVRKEWMSNQYIMSNIGY